MTVSENGGDPDGAFVRGLKELAVAATIENNYLLCARHCAKT